MPVSITLIPSSGGRIPSSIILVTTLLNCVSSFMETSSNLAVGHLPLKPKFLNINSISGCKKSCKKAFLASLSLSKKT